MNLEREENLVVREVERAGLWALLLFFLSWSDVSSSLVSYQVQPWVWQLVPALQRETLKLGRLYWKKSETGSYTCGWIKQRLHFRWFRRSFLFLGWGSWLGGGAFGLNRLNIGSVWDERNLWECFQIFLGQLQGQLIKSGSKQLGRVGRLEVIHPFVIGNSKQG